MIPSEVNAYYAPSLNQIGNITSIIYCSPQLNLFLRTVLHCHAHRFKNEKLIYDLVSLVFPAGILQPPYFNKKFPK